MTRTLLLATFFYAAITLVLGMTWHFILFKDLYDSLGIYNRQEPIIPARIYLHVPSRSDHRLSLPIV